MTDEEHAAAMKELAAAFGVSAEQAEALEAYFLREATAAMKEVDAERGEHNA